jgi:hypothetical protein
LVKNLGSAVDQPVTQPISDPTASVSVALRATEPLHIKTLNFTNDKNLNQRWLVLPFSEFLSNV